MTQPAKPFVKALVRVVVGLLLSLVLCTVYFALTRGYSFGVPVIDWACVALVVGCGIPLVLSMHMNWKFGLAAATISCGANAFVCFYWALYFTCRVYGNCI